MGNSSDRPVALITGAEGGIGSALASLLSEAGYDLILGHYPGRVSANWQAYSTDWLPVPVDVRDPASVQELVAKGRQRYGRISAVVTLAGMISATPFADLSADEWDQMLAVNLTGMFLTCAAVRADIIASKGSIVLTSSQLALTAADGNAGYVAAKAGVIGLARALSRELAPHVRVNCVAPGVIDTPMTQPQATPEWVRRKKRAASMGRIGAPEEAAATIRWLLSGEASYITGQTIHVNGGGYLGG